MISIKLSGPEGPGRKEFKTLEEAKDYIVPRIQWINNPDGGSFNTDYVNYELVGFKLQDIGINPMDHRP